MGIRFSKSFKICNGVKINLSKSGVSLTVGKKGASVNVGKKGTYVNLGLPGTGLSYRQKLKLGEVIKKDDTDTTSIYKTQAIDTKLYKKATNVVSRETFEEHLASLENTPSYDTLAKVIAGDKETIEALIQHAIDKEDCPYDIKTNYELEDHVLYFDLDLPEIEDIEQQEDDSALKETYYYLVISLAIYLAANYFNVSPYIESIIMSGFTQRRNNIGELTNVYLYSIIFTRDIFEQTDLKTIDSPYDFILHFANRINVSKTYTFKAIVPYKKPNETTQDDTSPLIDETIEGLKALGYKVKEINTILPTLKTLELKTSDAYLKEALLLLLKNKSLDTFESL